MKKLFLLITGLLLLFNLEGQILRYSNYVAPTPPSSSVDSVGWEAEYKDVYYLMTNRPPVEIADLQNDLVKSLIDGGYWTNRMELFYLFSQYSNTNGEAYINWVNPGTYNLTVLNTYSAPAFTSLEGLTSDNATTVLTTSYVPSVNATNISQNSVTLAAYTRTNAAGWDVAIGTYGYSAGEAELTLLPGYGTSITGAVNDLTETNYGSGLSATGFSLLTRRGASEIEAYKNDTSVGTSAVASLRLPNTAFYVFAENASDSYPQGIYNGQISVVFVLNAVSDAEATAIYTIIQTYMTAIDKEV